MLAELLTFLTTRCPPYVRRMGYLYEAIAVVGRERRNRSSWKPHLVHSRRHVLTAAEECPDRGRAVIIGSGPLLDVPLKELTSLFREVVLADIVCLRKTLKTIGSFGNARFIGTDVTGTAEPLYCTVKDGRGELPEPCPFFPAIDKEAALVVSLNVLSQLAVMPTAYARKKLPEIAEDRVKTWGRRIAESHYAALRRLPCDVCMISDYSFTERDHTGRVVGQGSTVDDIALPDPDESWCWDIAPRGEDSRSVSRELHVGAWHMGQRDR